VAVAAAAAAAGGAGRIGGGHHGKHAPGVADFLGEHAGVDPADPRHALSLQPRAERLHGVPVGVVVGVVLDDERLGVDLVALERVGQALGVEALGVGGRKARHAVVANHGGSAREELARVRRVGQGLGVPDHAGLEDAFARHGLVRAERLALRREGA
jgi:opacity protein-like surface antigen